MSTMEYYRELAWAKSYAVDLEGAVICICEFNSVKYFDQQRFELALHKCIDQHHNLQLNMNSLTKPNQFYFIKQPYSTPLYIEFQSKDEWKQIVNNELNTPFKLILLYDKNPMNHRQYLLL
ncbi:unnamed protein product [Adineta steineri]|uniref:Uncharacterized protein n=1 Tax=Adineta steineri TaxID=433720 RepID=A0A815XI31_9BILA|nr:unnamed protein product [Adineta steineri]CAF1663618.1 unnamed protein product [Adineta steineri]